MTAMVRDSLPDILPDDILCVVLAIAEQERGGQQLRFQGHDFDLQQVFGQLSKQYPVLRQYFVFSNAGPIPYSPSLTESVSRLQLSGLIGRENPEYEFLFVKPAAREYFERVVRKLDGSTMGQLREVAKAFLKSIAA